MFHQQDPNDLPFRQRDFSASLRPMAYGFNSLNPVCQRPLPYLPGLLGQIELALTATGADQASVLGHLCAVASVMAQGVADGAWPNDRLLPAGCSAMTVVPSGVSKSLMTDLVISPVRQAWDSREVPRLDRKKEEPQEGATPRDDPEDQDKRPAPSLIVEDVTTTALVEHLKDWPVLGLFTDETAIVAEILRKDAGLLAKLSDGTPYSKSRGQSHRVNIAGHRFVMFLQAQPDVFQKNKVFLGASGGGGIGFINRVLILRSTTPSSQANNFSVKMPSALNEAFVSRVEELMGMSTDSVLSGIKRPIVELNETAKISLQANQHDVRMQWGQVPFMGEYLNRHAERILRLAVALHVFEFGPGGQVSAETLAFADAIGRKALEDFFVLAVPPRKITRAERDAHVVADALIKSNGGHLFPIQLPYKLVMENATNLGLSTAQLSAALRILARLRLVFTAGEGRQKIISADLFNISLWMQDNRLDGQMTQLPRIGGTI